MNILPQKSWHVRTRKNIERVRRDEAKAAEEEKERQRRIALAEQEARTDLLRKRALSRHGGDEIEHSGDKIPRLGGSVETEGASTEEQGSSRATDIYTQTGHINFFKEVEAGEVKSGKNAEHEEEKRAEKEKWEKDIGLLTYLGQSAVESKEKSPWYLSGRKREKEPLDPAEKDRKLKASLDPLNQMKSYMHKTKHKHKHEEKKYKQCHIKCRELYDCTCPAPKRNTGKTRPQSNRETDISLLEIGSEKEIIVKNDATENPSSEKHHKHKHKKKGKEKESREHVTATKTIEQLRAERLNRERQERQRALDLLSGGQGQRSKAQEEPVNERDRGYNSVFNPDLARKPKQRRHYEDRY